MKVRILTSIGIAVFGLPILFLSEYLVYPMAVALLSLAAMYEMSALTGFRSKPAVCIPTYLIAVAMPIGAYFTDANSFDYLTACAGLLFLFLLYCNAYAVLGRGRIKFSDIASHFMTVAYISVSFTSLTLVRYIDKGAYVFALVFVACWVCDVFAYFVGRAIGKHKLIVEISPKKTVEGSIGGIVFTTLAFALYGFIITLLNGPEPSYLILVIMGFVLSIIAQFGDLICSLIKREHGVKDYGNIFPGHGGVLDRFDSILAVAPVLYVFCVFFAPFG
ncbi:MAG: phosphatidate cytidylyltransferase [Clostridia bacterium]|nr:phosphatidate cytidylyltransferase [Clostridia bacterium]